MAAGGLLIALACVAVIGGCGSSNGDAAGQSSRSEQRAESGASASADDAANPERASPERGDVSWRAPVGSRWMFTRHTVATAWRVDVAPERTVEGLEDALLALAGGAEGRAALAGEDGALSAEPGRARQTRSHLQVTIDVVRTDEDDHPRQLRLEVERHERSHLVGEASGSFMVIRPGRGTALPEPGAGDVFHARWDEELRLWLQTAGPDGAAAHGDGEGDADAPDAEGDSDGAGAELAARRRAALERWPATLRDAMAWRYLRPELPRDGVVTPGMTWQLESPVLPELARLELGVPIVSVGDFTVSVEGPADPDRGLPDGLWKLTSSRRVDAEAPAMSGPNITVDSLTSRLHAGGWDSAVRHSARDERLRASFQILRVPRGRSYVSEANLFAVSVTEDMSVVR